MAMIVRAAPGYLPILTNFPLLFSNQMQIIEPAFAYLIEQAELRAHSPETVRTYGEHLYDWFDALEQSDRHHAASSPATRHQCWNALKFFARFLADGGSAPADLTTELFGRYILWLDGLPSRTGKPRAPGLRHNRYQPVKLLTEWIARRRPDLLPVRPSFPFNPFPGRHAPKEGHRLSGSQLKAILRSCYEEIEDAWALFEEGQRLLSAQAKSDDPDGFETMLRELHRLGHGVMPSRRALPDRLGRRLHLHGGHDRFERHLHATPDCLAPFFIAIAIQTAGNVEALRLIDRDCIEPHPLIEHRTMIDWQKGRAGHLVKRAQRRSFDRRRRYAAPNLIDKLLKMTAPLAARAPASEKDRLFLMHRPSRNISVIQRTTLEGAIARFIERANRRINAWNANHPDQLRIAALPHQDVPRQRRHRALSGIGRGRAGGADRAQSWQSGTDGSLYQGRLKPRAPV
ncbi:hypothetical protein ABIG06_001685 [Bradyrhizobium sp. USDA 326]|uniref:hypothetical protein n=1 Tax=Bradyrhizobium sp. USDA 326 TaxID=3377726 RepID=UPI003C745D9F